MNLVPSDEDAETGELRYSKPGGRGVHVQWHAHHGFAASGCAVNGVGLSF